MLPGLICYPSLEDSNDKTKQTNDDCNDDTNESSNHHISRSTASFRPLFEYATGSRIQYCLIQVDQTAAEIPVPDFVLAGAAIGVAMYLQACLVK